MAHQTPNRKTIAIVLSAVFIAITMLTGVLASLKNNPYQVDKPVVESESSSVSLPSDEESDPEDSIPDSSEESQPEDSASEESSESEDAQEPDEDETVYYNVPDEMRAVMLVAGRDYLTSPETTDRATIAGQIDQALNAAKELTMNTIIIDTKYQDQVLFSSKTLSQAEVDLDCTDYITTKARDFGFYVYATYDVTDGMDGNGYVRLSNSDGDTLDAVAESVGSFAEKYKFDGILLNNYYNTASGGSYAQYVQSGGGMGYQNYLRQVPAALVDTAVKSIRGHAPGTQVGLLAEAVWQNAADDPEGTETSAAFTALRDGNADTRAFVQSGDFDFVMVENYGSTNEQTARFGIVADWWSKVTSEASVPLYIMHASDRVGTQSTGWTVYEQLTKQVIDLEKVSNIYGHAFNSFKALQDNPGNSTTTLIQYMNDQIDEQYVLSQLALTKPAQTTFTTKEPSVTFQGASDPREPVTVNGEKIPTNDSGYFTIKEDLKAGVNTFEISHKNKTFTYTITRQVEVLKEIWPTGSINVDGGMQVSVSALAYEGATVTASIGGQNITLALSETEDDEIDRDSGYQRYTGVFTAPSASASPTSLGTITVTASAQGATKTLTGAAVTVNKIAKMGDGAIVQVVADQAETFPISTLNDNSNPGYFPLPLGTTDMTYGSEIIYKDGKKSYSYWKLQSGVRVYSDDIKATGNSLPDQNEISKMSIQSGSQYTTVTLTTKEKVPYKVTYDGTKLVFAFEYTASVPDSATLKNNALFSAANWSGSSLTLTLRKTGGFLGYKAYYEDGNLLLRFNNSPGSLSGARIVVDPGHGGSDPGAVGFYPGKDEADINLAVANKLVSELKSRGASVLMVTPGSTMASRLSAARAFNPQVLVSVHCNTSPSSSAKGTEVYYFYPFQKQLAANIAANVSSALNTTNRGAKAGLYYMTRESQFACVLAELGFMSNESEYTRLISSKYQSRIAEAIANGVNGYLSGTNSGGGTGGTDDSSSSSSSSDSLSLSDDVLNMDTGETAVLSASGDTEVTWKSEDTSIATVNSSGKITAKSEGTTYITATAGDGGESVECEVNVGKTGGSSVTGVSLNKTTLNLSEGDTYTLTATVKPSTASNRKVTWESDDEDIATVSSTGKVTAVDEGETWITVTTKDGDYSADCKVVVGKADRSGGLIRSITISGESRVAVGTRIELTASVSPSNAADPGVKWKSSDSEIAVVSNTDDDSCKVEGVKNGTVTITATAYDDGKESATFKLKVGTGTGSGSSNSSSDVDPERGVMPTGVTITGSSALKRGTRSEYVGKISPNNCEDPGVKWSVSDSDILTIYRTDDENVIKVEGSKTGTAYLIGESYLDGSVYKRFKITVTS
ncbi:N-acetylmuramoyl-L-alanine amidase [Marasmitruncus massiliensis]|uniref:N-acetylmuramoyl-L-alanine amidase n=1 Tax=Marasmitruncus massiliensis TaxID=1944642 RepID=UPI000C7CFD7E|nr:N-acetylmuramoyl-L-alanine amidase [Marasmitruncus massiliensis]